MRRYMQTPIEQILSSFEGLTLWHFLPVLLVGVLVIIISILRRGKPKSYTWSRERGLTPLLESVLTTGPPEKLKEAAAKLGLSEADIEDLKSQLEAKAGDT